MSIVGAALLPHTPLLLPTTAPAHAKHVRPLARACADVAAWVHALQPDIILCVNPHGMNANEAFSFNLAATYTGGFETFGDLTTTVQVRAAPTFSYHLKEHVEAFAPVFAVHESQVSYGVSIPALLLQPHVSLPKWVEITTATRSPREHVQFGTLLHAELINVRERVLIIASGEVSARCSEESPSGKSANATAFCKRWSKAMHDVKLQEYLSNLTLDDVREVLSCGAMSMSILAGCMQSIRVAPTVHAHTLLYGTTYSVVTWQPV